MGFWGSLGKTLLSAAPYVAAPFTGGASLLAAPATNAVVGKLNSNAAQKGKLSGYDRGLGLASNLASSFAGAYSANKFGDEGGGGGMFGRTPSFAGGMPWESGIVSTQKPTSMWRTLGDALGRIGGQVGSPNAKQPMTGTPSTPDIGRGGIGPSDPTQMAGPNMRTPNLQTALDQGRQEALMNQPWRNQQYQFTPGQRLNIYPQYNA